MDKALDGIGRHISLQRVVVLTLAITEDLMVQINASRTVGSHLRHCKCCKDSSCEMFASKRFGSYIPELTGTMYPVHGCKQVATLLYFLRKSAVIQHRYLLPQDRLEVCAHMCQSLTHHL
jgi:hypothetical protein